MRIIFIHQNLPGQYRTLMPHCALNPANEVIGIGEDKNIRRNFTRIPERLKVIGYQMPNIPTYTAHNSLLLSNEYVHRGEVVARVLVNLKNQGFKPDVICCHPGWGESLYIKDVFPDVRLISYCEFYYNSKGQDFGFDPEIPEKPFSEWELRTRNAIQLLILNAMDVGISPTQWQATRYPKEYHNKIRVIHDGVKTDLLAPNNKASIHINDKNLTLTIENEVITFVNRNFEPYRGFHIFMRALPEILARRPKAHVIMVGGDDVSYGKKIYNNTYRQWMMEQVGSKIDMARVHFVGRLAYAHYVRVLQISTAHVYLTYPFVLSWSMMEAMSSGCLVIGSRTAPVEEIIKHGDNGLLVDFFAIDQIVETVCQACENRNDMMEIRKRARQTIVDKYDYDTICFPQQVRLIEEGMGMASEQKVPTPAPPLDKKIESVGPKAKKSKKK